jgi:hypothetical protein
MPTGCTEGTLKVAIEGLDIPTHVIESCKFPGGELDRVQRRGYQPTSSKTVSNNKNYPHSYCRFVGIIYYFTEIVTLCQFARHLRTGVFPGRDDEVCGSGHNLPEGATKIKTRIQQKQLALLEAADQFLKQSVFRGAHLAVDKSQGCTADQIEDAAKLNSNRAQSLRSPV